MINDVPSNSTDITEHNIDKLKELFPEILTDGNKIDFDKLQLILGEEIDSEKERYSFNWPGKREAIIGAQQPSKGTLRPNLEKSKNFDTTENLYIEGDNLEALKLLQKSYNNKIKVIYIDPPYNTGKDFVYKDNFRDGVNNYLEQTGQVDSEGNLLSTNSESNGRFHTDWLNMIYPRLNLARNLLKDDGVIFVSIDDNEVNNLRKIMDEIFGEKNFISQMVIDATPKNDPLLISTSHEYVLVYVKNKNMAKESKWGFLHPLNKELNKIIAGKEHHEAEALLKKYYSKNKLTKDNISNYKYVDANGIFRIGPLDDPQSKGAKDTRINLKTGKPLPTPNRGWSCNLDTWNKWNENNLIFYPSDPTKLAAKKTYLDNEKIEIGRSVIKLQNRKNTNYLKELFNGEKIFDNPKSLSLMNYLLNLINDDNYYVLDFFSGSGSMADAVIRMNAENNKNISYIMIQLPEQIEERKIVGEQYFETIADVGSERIRRAGEMIISENPDISNSLDVGFKYLALDKSNIKEWNTDFENIESELDLFSDVFVEGRSELDIVYEIMLKNGLELTLLVDTFEANGKKIYDIAYGHQFICLSDEIDTNVARAIIEKHNEYGPEITSGVVFKDSGFSGNDSEKLNCIQLLKDAGFIEANLQTI